MTGQCEGQLPQSGHAISPTQQNLRSPQSCCRPLWQLELEALFLVHLVGGGFEVHLLWKCFWCTKSEFGVESVDKKKEG